MGILSCLMIVVLVLLVVPKQVQCQSDTTTFNYTIFNHVEPHLSYEGDANPTLFLLSVSLTAADDRSFPSIPFQHSVGRVVYTPPIRLWDGAGRRQANFQTVIRGYIGNRRNPFIGDGFAFFIAPVNATFPTDSSDGNMGLYNPLTGNSPSPTFAVELDIFENRWDPDYRHVGININSRNSLKVESWDFRGLERNVEARITYDARARLITVVANATAGVAARVEHEFDLKTLFRNGFKLGSPLQRESPLHFTTSQDGLSSPSWSLMTSLPTPIISCSLLLFPLIN